MDWPRPPEDEPSVLRYHQNFTSGSLTEAVSSGSLVLLEPAEQSRAEQSRAEQSSCEPDRTGNRDGVADSDSAE